MSSIIKWATISLIGGHLLNCLCKVLKTDFLLTFLESNLITILIALLALNTATIGIILSRLGSITDKCGMRFPMVVSAMKQSIVEQLVLIIVATLSLIFRTSPVVRVQFDDSDFYFGSLIIAVGIYAIVTVYDTAEAAFALNDEAEKIFPRNDPPRS